MGAPVFNRELSSPTALPPVREDPLPISEWHLIPNEGRLSDQVYQVGFESSIQPGQSIWVGGDYLKKYSEYEAKIKEARTGKTPTELEESSTALHDLILGHAGDDHRLSYDELTQLVKETDLSKNTVAWWIRGHEAMILYSIRRGEKIKPWREPRVVALGYTAAACGWYGSRFLIYGARFLTRWIVKNHPNPVDVKDLVKPWMNRSKGNFLVGCALPFAIYFGLLGFHDAVKEHHWSASRDPINWPGDAYQAISAWLLGTHDSTEEET